MLLDVRDIVSSYELSQVLFGVSFCVGDGEVVTLMGRNGMGKTTTVRSLMGLVRPHAGEIRLRGERVDGLPPHRMARLGLGLVPEGRQIFPNLTVRENLVMAEHRRGGDEAWTVERVFELFPRLAERMANRGNHLSGGEQQMLAIGRALMTNPALLVLDEATEGLAPKIREEIWTKLQDPKHGTFDHHHRQRRGGAVRLRRPPLHPGKRRGDLDRLDRRAHRQQGAAEPLSRRVIS